MQSPAIHEDGVLMKAPRYSGQLCKPFQISMSLTDHIGHTQQADPNLHSDLLEEILAFAYNVNELVNFPDC